MDAIFVRLAQTSSIKGHFVNRGNSRTRVSERTAPLRRFWFLCQMPAEGTSDFLHFARVS